MEKEKKQDLITRLAEVVKNVGDVNGCVFIVCNSDKFASMIKGTPADIETMVYNALEDYPNLHDAITAAMAKYHDSCNFCNHR